FHARAQVDLVNMSNTPGGPNKEFNYILHYQDHFTKFSLLRVIKTKEASAVADVLQPLFELIGPPRILQSDNGKEFTAKVIRELCARMDISIINGRPYHPQSQGSVESANKHMK